MINPVSIQACSAARPSRSPIVPPGALPVLSIDCYSKPLTHLFLDLVLSVANGVGMGRIRVGEKGWWSARGCWIWRRFITSLRRRDRFLVDKG